MQNVQVRDELLETLRAFRARVEGSPEVKKLIAKWDRTIEVRVVTFPRRSLYVRTEGGAMLEPTGVRPGEPEITIVADEDVLAAVFRGEVNPARAHLDGALQAIGPQKDQLVLDSVVLLLWGY